MWFKSINLFFINIINKLLGVLADFVEYLKLKVNFNLRHDKHHP
jgi:hypothetical protein